MTIVGADTTDMCSIEQFKPQDATAKPQLPGFEHSLPNLVGR
jgi:hypothetical protein